MTNYSNDKMALAVGVIRKCGAPSDQPLADSIKKEVIGAQQECQNCHYSDDSFLTKGYIWCRKKKASMKEWRRAECFLPRPRAAGLMHDMREGKPLTLQLKKEHFNAIKSGVKPYEYRLKKPHWETRLEDRHYDYLVLTLGYPKRTDQSRRIVLPYLGYEKDIITHPEFGSEPVKVYAIIIARNHLPRPAFKSLFHRNR